MKHPFAIAVATMLAGGLAPQASAQRVEAQTRIENGVAVFAALDKVTARISKLEVKLGETASFGALKVTPRACYSRPPTEAPKTTTFVQVHEIQLDGAVKEIFSGWMFAESPGLNAVEHPVYDVWLTDCIAPRLPAPAVTAGRPARGAQPAAAGQPATGQPTAGQPPAGAATAAPGEGEFKRKRPPR